MRNWKTWSFLVGLGLVACGSSERTSDFDQLPGPDSSTTADGGSEGGFGEFGGSNNALVIDPDNAIVFIDTATTPPTPGKLAFKVLRKSSSGDKDVTAGAVFELEKPELGKFTGNNFESVATLPPDPPGVTTSVTVKADGGTTGGKITVVPLRRSTDQRDFFFIEPYNQPPSPSNDVLKFKTNIQAVDVAFVVDTTGSMSPEIAGIKAALQGTLLQQLQAAIPSVGMSIVSHQDTTDGANLVKVLQVTTPTLSVAQSGASRLSLGDGGDTPEGQIAAMYHVLTGAALPNVPAHTPAAGTKGGVDFRPGAAPVVVLISDASWHDASAGITLAQLTTAFGNANAKFVHLGANPGQDDNISQANTLSDGTKSSLPPAAFVGCAAGQCCTGVNGAARAPTGPGGTCRLNFLYTKSSPNLGKGIVDAIKAIAVGSTYDVTVRPRNDAKNANNVDATKFIKALRAKDEGDATQGCPAHAAKDTNGDGIKDTFIAVTVGTPVCFEVVPAVNTTAEPQATAQFYNAFLDVVGVPGDVKLDERKVLFLVPPKAQVTK